LGLTLLRLAFEPAYRSELSKVGQSVLFRHGGLLWAGLVLWMAASIFWAASPIMARFEMIHALAVLLLGIVVASITQRGWDTPVLWAFALGGAVQGALAVPQFLGGGPLGLGSLGEVGRFWYDTASYYRATGLSMHPNYLGGYQILAVFAVILLVRRALSHKTTGFWLLAPLVLSGVTLAGLVATLSRSALLGLAVGSAFAVWPSLPALRRGLTSALPRIAVIIVALLAIGVGAFAAIVLLPNAGTRLFAGREFFFEDSWRVTQRNPVLGAGAGSLMLVVARDRGFTSEPLLPVHNTYLFTLAELGIPGMLLYVLACGFIVWGTWRARAAPKVYVWGCGLIALAVIGLFDNYWWAVHPHRTLFFAALGLWWGYRLAQFSKS
jgi:O-antigen ligase